ncbi:MAG TPA: STAS domain-containing protein [Candidatus Acidoferrales bacterium]|nr:STAS domain-containing protein [Candidatus Acidoferrales bacterium]
MLDVWSTVSVQGNAFIQEAVDGGAHCLHVLGDLDIANVREFEAAVASAVRGGNRLVLDLSQCSFIDCSALTVLVRTYERLGKRLCVVTGSQGVVTFLFELTGLGQWLPVVPTLAQAFGSAASC